MNLCFLSDFFTCAAMSYSSWITRSHHMLSHSSSTGLHRRYVVKYIVMMSIVQLHATACGCVVQCCLLFCLILLCTVVRHVYSKEMLDAKLLVD